MPETLTARQRQTRAGRQALAEQFPNPEAKAEHYRALGRRSAARRLTLSADEATAVVEAYSLLGRIAERARLKLANAPNEESAGSRNPRPGGGKTVGRGFQGDDMTKHTAPTEAPRRGACRIEAVRVGERVGVALRVEAADA